MHMGKYGLLHLNYKSIVSKTFNMSMKKKKSPKLLSLMAEDTALYWQLMEVIYGRIQYLNIPRNRKMDD